MADIELVIKIPEELYNYMQTEKYDEHLEKRFDWETRFAVKNGTPPRCKGYWIPTNDYIATAYGSIDYVKCSCCREDSLEESNYCPHCGAEMG